MWDLVAAVLQGAPSSDPYYTSLDAAVMEKFPDVECKTYFGVGFEMKTETRFGKHGGGLLEKKQERAVRRFIRDWKRAQE